MNSIGWLMIFCRDPNLLFARQLLGACWPDRYHQVRVLLLFSTHTAADFKLLPTYHPSAVPRQWELCLTVIADFYESRPRIRLP